MTIMSCTAAQQNTNKSLQFWALAELPTRDVQLSTISQDQSGKWNGAPNFQWSPAFPNPPAKFQKIVAASQGGSRGAQFWAIDTQGTLFSIFQETPTARGNWSGPDWNNAPVKFKDISVCQFPDASGLVIGIGMDNRLCFQEQQGPGQSWNQWRRDLPAGAPLSKGLQPAVCPVGNRYISSHWI
jgi:hypothetical protein